MKKLFLEIVCKGDYMKTYQNLNNILHCLKVMADEEVCEECELYSLGDIHCRDIARSAIELIQKQIPTNKIKPMYVVKFNNDEYWCGNNKFDKQIRKSQIFHSIKYANDVCEKFKELEPKIIQIEINIIGEVK